MSEAVDFALLGHPSSYGHLGDILFHSRPDYDTEKLRKYEQTLTKFFEWMPSYEARIPLEIAANGQTRSGRLIICTFLPGMLTSPRQVVQSYNKVAQACRLAQDMGARIVGLGGFTSIVTGDQGAKLIDELGITVTSGNSLTAAMALDQLDALLGDLDRDLADSRVAIIGATGDIGRALSLALAGRAGSLLLMARNRAKLEALAQELPEAQETSIATDVREVLGCDILLVVSSAPEPVLAESDLKPGTIVCDVSYPRNLSYAREPREDILTFSGGLVQMPFELPLGYYTQLARHDLMYGCFSEAIILSLAQQYESFSTGQGAITLEKMARIRELAAQYGFQPALPYRGHTAIDAGVLQRFQEHMTQVK